MDSSTLPTISLLPLSQIPHHTPSFTQTSFIHRSHICRFQIRRHCFPLSVSIIKLTCVEMRSNEMGRLKLVFSDVFSFLCLIFVMGVVLRVSANGEGLWFSYFFSCSIFSFILSTRTSYLVEVHRRVVEFPLLAV